MIKQYIPPPLRKILSRGKTYHQRLNLLRQMKNQIEGKTDADADILRRSFADGPRDLLKQLDVYRYPTLIEDATVCVREFGTFKVRGRTDDLAHVMPSFQKSVMDTAKKFAKSGSTVIDAGANIGAVSAPATGEGARVTQRVS